MQGHFLKQCERMEAAFEAATASTSPEALQQDRVTSPTEPANTPRNTPGGADAGTGPSPTLLPEGAADDSSDDMELDSPRAVSHAAALFADAEIVPPPDG